MLRLEPRSEVSKAWVYASPVLALLITIAVAGLLFVALGKDPVRGLSIFLIEPWANLRGASEIALKSIPLVLCALGLALCYRSNVWNIGAEGQFLMGAVFAGGLAMWATEAKMSVSPWAFMWVGMLAGAVGGALWAGIVALLRDKFNANEILVSLMLVYVANLLLSYLVFGPWKDPQGFNFPQTVTFDDGTLIPRIVRGFRLHWGFVIALIAVVLMTVFLFRTYKGYQLQVGGLAPAAARYAGFSSRKALWFTLLTSGALAGLAGGMEALGPLAQLTPHVSLGYGFTAIIVAFIGRLHPVGCVLGAVLLSMFLIGGELAQSRIGLPSALSNVFQGVLLVALLACDTLIHYKIRSKRVNVYPGDSAKKAPKQAVRA
jgi:general nucleoside transport system permease protein